jgi:hypothetical protein
MKKTKFNPQLLKEELNRFKSINEYSFGMRERRDDDELILGSNHYLGEADEDPEAAASAIANDLGVTPPSADAATPPADFGGEAPAGGAAAPAEPNPANAEDPAAAAPAPEAAPEPPMAPIEGPIEEPAADEEEIDVTELVDSTDEAKNAADKASHNTKLLMKKLEDLESRIASMDAVNGKIEALEKEIIKRNPTNVEKLEMQSLHSGPYTQKLTDYWADKHGAYDVMGNDKKQEYVLDKDTIDSDYSEGDIKQSFAVKPEDYEEEDI